MIDDAVFVDFMFDLKGKLSRSTGSRCNVHNRSGQANVTMRYGGMRSEIVGAALGL